ncbi:MAG: c-type cytochrome [Micrococcales bacterium]|nr:c-type cytochrome [Micrococcales bacterium]
MNSLAARRRHPAAIALLLLLGLLVTGAVYSALAPQRVQAAAAADAGQDAAQGKKLFQANCATCHGLNATGTEDGPSLVGVGAASVDFQMGTGRMPMAAPGVQAPRSDKIKFSNEQIAQIGAYVATLGPGPSVPDSKYTDGTSGDAGRGGEIFRVNCAMCHNAAGAGGALTRGKYAPTLQGVKGKHIYEAMETGPQSMPVFNDSNLDPQAKADVITYLKSMEREGNPGGYKLGGLGPVPEGLFAWTIGLAVMVGAAVWLGQKGA